MDKRFEGLTVADLEAAIEMIKAREAEEAAMAKAQVLDEARVTMVDAAIKYMLALDIITQEEIDDTDWNGVIEDVKKVEEKLPSILKAIDMMNHGPFGMMTPKIKVRVNGHEANDDEMDILKKFIASQM